MKMAERRKLKRVAGVLALILIITTVDSKQKKGYVTSKLAKHKIQLSRSKINIDKGNPWPFLPSPGSHYSVFPGYPKYPFLILAPPDAQSNNEERLKDAQGSKYYTNRRQSVAYPQTAPPGYVPVYYMAPQYNNAYQSLYSNYYQPYQNNPNLDGLDGQYLQYSSNYGSVQPYAMNPFIFFKRSETKKLYRFHRKLKPVKRQFVPRHHWAFSQWPFDSHEYAFTKGSSNAPHLPRWGPMEWGGVGPRRHWGINRQGITSPFGIGLAPHMGGQGYLGLGGHWPAGHRYPLPTNFPNSPLSQHNIP